MSDVVVPEPTKRKKRAPKKATTGLIRSHDIRMVPTEAEIRQFYDCNSVRRWVKNLIRKTYMSLYADWVAAGKPEPEASAEEVEALAAYNVVLASWKANELVAWKRDVKEWKQQGSRGKKPEKPKSPKKPEKPSIDLATLFNRPFGEKPDLERLKLQFNLLRPVYAPWTSEKGHRDCWSQPFVDFANAIQKWKAGGGPPAYEKHTDAPSFYVANDKFELKGASVSLPKMRDKTVRLAEHLRFQGTIQGARVTGDSAGNWYLSVQVANSQLAAPVVAIPVATVPVEATPAATGMAAKTPKADRKMQKAAARQIKVKALPVGTEAIGIDVGIATAITISTGETFQPPHSNLTRRQRKALKGKKRRLSRSISRKHEVYKQKRAEARSAGGDWKSVHPSNNERKERRALNRIFVREARQLQDWQHKTTTALVRRASPEHGIGIETVSPAKWMQSGMKGWASKLAKIGLGEIRRQVVYKTEAKGIPLTQFPWNYPSTQGCSNPAGCDHRQKMALSDRIFTCEKCGYTRSRDHNAAQNMAPTAANLAKLSRLAIPSSESVVPSAWREKRGPRVTENAVEQATMSLLVVRPVAAESAKRFGHSHVRT